MLFYLLQCQATSDVLGAETLQEQGELLAEVRLQRNVFGDDEFSESLGIYCLLLAVDERVLERRLADDQLVEQAAQAPDVDLDAVALPSAEHLRSDVLGRADHRVRQVLTVLYLLTYAKI